MKPASFILIFLIIAAVLGIFLFKYVFSLFPGLQKMSLGGDGGIFKSTDQGESWIQLDAEKGEGDEKTKIKISGLNIYDIEIYPGDSKIIFAGTQGKGFIKSFDSGNSWQRLPRGSWGASGDILNIAIDAKNPQHLYLASYFGNRGRILKSENSGESFKEVFVAHADKVRVLQVEVDGYDSSIVFASTSDGLFLQSSDSGQSWKIIKNFEEGIQKFMICPKDSREIYLFLEKRGLFKTADKGLTWKDIGPNLEKLYSRYKLGKIQELSIDSLLPNLIYVGAGSKLFRSYNKGEDFEEITSFIVGKDYQISTILIDFADSFRIYIGGGAQLYKSADGGKQWVVKKLNTNRDIKVLKIDPNNPSVIYAGLGG